MATDPLTGSRYPLSSAVPNVAQDIQNAVIDLADNTIPRFSTTTARDTAYSSWVTLGGVMQDGLKCSVNGVPYRRINGNWRIDRNRNIVKAVTGLGTGSSISSGGANETGVTSGIALSGGANFTLYEAATIAISAAFRAGPGTGAAQCTVKINNVQVGNVAISRTDGTVPVVAAVALATGTHAVSLRVDAIAGGVTWVDGIVSIIEGTAE